MSRIEAVSSLLSEMAREIPEDGLVSLILWKREPGVIRMRWEGGFGTQLWEFRRFIDLPSLRKAAAPEDIITFFLSDAGREIAAFLTKGNA